MIILSCLKIQKVNWAGSCLEFQDKANFMDISYLKHTLGNYLKEEAFSDGNDCLNYFWKMKNWKIEKWKIAILQC